MTQEAHEGAEEGLLRDQPRDGKSKRAMQQLRMFSLRRRGKPFAGVQAGRGFRHCCGLNACPTEGICCKPDSQSRMPMLFSGGTSGRCLGCGQHENVRSFVIRVTETAVCVAIHQGPSPCPGPPRLRNLMLNVFLFAFQCWKYYPGPGTCSMRVHHSGTSPALGFLR